MKVSLFRNVELNTATSIMRALEIMKSHSFFTSDVESYSRLHLRVTISTLNCFSIYSPCVVSQTGNN